MNSTTHKTMVFKNGNLIYTNKNLKTKITDEKSNDFIPFAFDENGLIKYDDISTLEHRLSKVYPFTDDNYSNYLLNISDTKDLSRKEIKLKKSLEKQNKLYFNYLNAIENKKCPASYCNRCYHRDSIFDEIIALVDNEDGFCVTFYVDKENETSYVSFGGYGKTYDCNPFLYFLNEGYGKSFEAKMTKNCYNWLVEEVLPLCLECVGLSDDKCNNLIKVFNTTTISEGKDNE